MAQDEGGRLNLHRLIHLFRPAYGEHYIVRPKHWWHPRQRKAARIAAAVADHLEPEVRAQTVEHVRRRLIYGDPSVTPTLYDRMNEAYPSPAEALEAARRDIKDWRG
jgi:hypothetical protein